MMEDEKDKILRDVKKAETFCKTWHSNIVGWRNLYDLKHHQPAELKKGESYFDDPTHTNTVDLAVGILITNEMHWHAKCWNPTIKTEEKGGAIEKYLAGLVFINSLRNQYNVHYETIQHFVRDGVGVLYSVWDPIRDIRYATTIKVPDENSPEGVRIVGAYTEPPVILKVVDPLNIFVLPGDDERWYCIARVEKKSVADVEAAYGVKLSRYKGYTDDQKGETKGRFIDYWRIELSDRPMKDESGEPVMNAVLGRPETSLQRVVQNAVLFEDEYVWPLRDMDGYDDLPYTISFFKPTDRDVPGGWHNIMRPMETSIKHLERMINRRTRQIDKYAGLPLTATAHPGRTIQMDPELGQLVQLQIGENLGFPRWDGNPPDVDMQIDFFRSRIQQSGFSDVMYGAGPSQVSGYALSQLADQGRIRLEQPVLHLELLWAMWAKKVLSMTAKFAAGLMVRVYGRMRGEDFIEQIAADDAGEYLVMPEIRPEYPNDQTRKHAMASQARGVLSEHTLMQDYYNIDQPDDEFERKLIEMLRVHPIVVNYTLMQELQALAEEGDKVAEMALAAIQSGGMAGTPGRPKEPPSPTQAVGTQSPTGEAVPQAEGGVPYGQSEAEIFQGQVTEAPRLME